MNNNVLISTAMLNAYWENEKKDTLDLLLPFLKYSIAKTTDVGCNIDIEKLSHFLRTEFGYDSIPTKVITLLLNRLSPTMLVKQRDTYTLKVPMDNEITSFEKGRTQYSKQCSTVAKALKDFLDNNLSFGKVCSEDQALESLITFFATNGLCLIRDVALLEMLKKKDDALKYAIARFILSEHEKKSEVFSYIEDMVKGFFVSTVISLQPKNTTVAQSKFKGLKCYIDTRLVIDALGLHLPEAQTSALELLAMLKEKGAELCCFEHNCQEIRDIIAAYKHGLIYPKQNRPHQTLESWDAQKYKPADVERYQSLLERKINGLGINIVPKPQITDLTKYPFSNSELTSFIEEHMNYANQDALQTDIESIASIFLIRDGLKCSEIEKTKAIFVTSNIQLVNVSNMYLTGHNICDHQTETMPSITDIDLASIIWLKCYSTHKDYPTKRLIEYAMTALEPSPTMLKAFFEKVDHIQAEGGITEDEASILRADTFCRKELANSLRGDSSGITEQTIYDIKDKLRLLYVGDADENAALNYRKYVEEKEKQRDSIIRALKQIKEYSNKIFARVYFLLYTVARLIRIGVVLGFLVLSFMTNQNSDYMVAMIILLIFSLAGVIDMISSKWRFVKKAVERIARNISELYADKKKEEYESILGTIKYDMPDE